jgi:hypothetical protein
MRRSSEKWIWRAPGSSQRLDDFGARILPNPPENFAALEIERTKTSGSIHPLHLSRLISQVNVVFDLVYPQRAGWWLRR